MDLVNLRDFRHLSGLKADEILALLENGQLQLFSEEDGILKVNLESVSAELLAKRPKLKQLPINPNDLALLEESMVSQILDILDAIIQDALELALSWYKTEQAK